MSVRKHINRMDFKVMNYVCVCVCTHIHTSTKERPYEDLMRKQEERDHNTEAIITLIMDFLASITVRNKSLFLSCQVYSSLL